MSLKNFQVISKLGEGAYSSVYKVRRLSDNQEYALKRVKLSGLSEKEKENALNEVRILASIQSPNIVAYKEVFLDEHAMALCIVMEYADEGDLLAKVAQHKKSQSYMKEEDIWRYAVQMICGMKTLHDMKILHRDFKSANVFLSNGNQIKLGDLNVSKIMKNNLAYTQTGTPYYASPEVWKDQPYNEKSDIWSLGCVIYEMCALRPPFKGKDLEGLYQNVKKGVFDPIPSHYSLDLYHLISMCLQTNFAVRPSCDQLLKSARMKKLFPDAANENFANPCNELLNTIKLPKNIKWLSKQLPKPKYSTVKPVSNNASIGDISDYEHVAAASHKGSSKKLISQSSSFSGDSDNKSPHEKVVGSAAYVGQEKTERDSIVMENRRQRQRKEPERLPEIGKNHKRMNYSNVDMNEGALVHQSNSHSQLSEDLMSQKVNHNHRSKMYLKRILAMKRSPKESIFKNGNNMSCIEEIGGNDSVVQGRGSSIPKVDMSKPYGDYLMSEKSRLLNRRNYVKIPNDEGLSIQQRADKIIQKYAPREGAASHKDLYSSDLYPAKSDASREQNQYNSGTEANSVLNQYKRLAVLKRKISRFASNGKSREGSQTPVKLINVSSQ